MLAMTEGVIARPLGRGDLKRLLHYVRNDYLALL
jgi:hypothetical protein